ncbi:hypothetical protein AB0F88_01350 [Streptosporangium sp. NPDC023963]|uniref:hypothetical protein n=1 Tax=Streptosporangium sp. NPDC023963 TaxID=3155608 RepID=UPI003433DBB0
MTMKIRVIMATAVASVLLFPGTAAALAYPVEDAPLLTGNSLYTAGKLPAAGCADRPAKGKSLASVKKHVKALVDCMNDAWLPYLKEADLSSVPPSLEMKGTALKKNSERYCFGAKMDPARSEAVNCFGRYISVHIRPDWIKASDDLPILVELSSVYGEYVQHLVDIREGYNALHADDDKEIQEQLRRYSLQANCLGGITAKGVWHALGYPAKDARRLLDLAKADADAPKGKDRYFGKSANVAYWTKRGYSTSDPRSCKTWTAPSSKVS